MGFQLTGIAILLAFYGCYAVKMWSQRRRGIQTDQMGKGKSGAARWIEFAVKTSAYGTLAAELCSIFWNPAPQTVPVRIAGAAVGAAGAAVFIVSVVCMQDSWRAGVPGEGKTELVTRGIYQISRNPAFLGFDLVYLGLTMMFFNWGLFALSLLAVFLLHLQIVKVEEAFLEEAFGEAYLAYKGRVCRYFGRR